MQNRDKHALVILGIVFTGSIIWALVPNTSPRSTSADFTTPSPPQAPQESAPPAFRPGRETIIGDWYMVATNPNPEYFGKIPLSGVAYYSFQKTGRIQMIFPGGNTYLGRWSYDEAGGTFASTVNIDGTAVNLAWQQVDEANARIVNRNGNSANDPFVRKGTPEWDRRGKYGGHEEPASALPTENFPHTIASNTSLAPKNGRRIELHVRDRRITREQAAALIARYRSVAGPDGQVSIRKPDKSGEMQPWAVDNMDGNIQYNDFFFE